MANKQPTFFQRMNRFFGSDVSTSADYTRKNVNTYKINDPKVLFATKDKGEYDAKALELRQNKLLNWKWRKANAQISNEQYMNITDVKMMYRDADLMDGFPEFGTAADLIMEEACYTPNTGKMVNVFSKSTRIKAILEDLLYNRLQINVTLPMIARCMVKYGNCFMLHDIDINNGLRGWRQLPVYEVERYENMASDNPYYSYFQNVNNIDLDREGVTRFVWVGQNEFTPYWNWQISHFRLLYDSISLPFGTSFFNKARRHFRMLSMMEDAMLMYRLERAVERRVFKVNVAAIDEDDVPAYIEDIANEFKRTPIVDPLTGQLDLRRNILPVWKKTPIPLLDGRVITIEELAREYENGKTNYVYSVQDETQQIVPGKVAWCGKNYTAKKMIKVTLDDGGYVVLAPEHEFIMRDGTRKRADELCVGESVMPFYSEIYNEKGKRMKGYEMVYNPNSGKYEFTHRLVANDIEKPLCEGKTINTVHHIDFNKRNNSPENLLWCNFDDHRKMHSELSTRNNLKRWSDPITRSAYMSKLMKYNSSELHKEHDKVRSKAMSEFWKTGNRDEAIRRMTVKFDDYVWDRISNAVHDGIVYNRESALEFINSELIDHILDINTNRRLHNLKCVSRTVLQERVKSIGFSSISEYLYHVHEEVGGVNPADVVKSKRSESMTIFNKNGRKRFVEFNEIIWNAIRQGILSKELNNVSDITRFVNNNLIDEVLSYNNIFNNDFFVDVATVTRRIRDLGFENTSDYIAAMRKNHKVAKIEYVDGDDVYCMTVLGLKGEEDRHNFAVHSIYDVSEQNNQKNAISGCFVANCQLDDFFIPVRDPNEPNPIETLPAAQNLTALDDIKYVLNKILIALRIPKPFLNFEESTGDGKNLSLMDVRFMRTINRIQQALIMELNKACIIHLAILGFADDLTNFSLTMNNPSSQAEMLEIENLAKKITTAKDAVTDNGNGIPLYSCVRAWKEILGWSEKEISDNLEELRLEAALAAELQKTGQIIKRTGLFDAVDNIYGEPGAEYGGDNGGEEEDDGMMGGGGGGGASFGGDFDLGGAPEGEDIEGAEGEMSMDQAAAEAADANAEGPGEGGGGMEMLSEALLNRKLKQLKERKKILQKDSVDRARIISEKLIRKVNEKKTMEEERYKKIPLFDKSFFVNEELDAMSKHLEAFLKERKASDEE